MPEQRESAAYPTDLPAWRALEAHRDQLGSTTLADLFARDTDRPARFQLQAGDLHLDYSKNLLSAETLELLLRLAEEAGVASSVEAMFAGEAINATENRAVLHVALRAASSDDVGGSVAGVTEVRQTLDGIAEYVDAVHDGRITGVGDTPLTNVVNVGIGGSDLGPVMASRALGHHMRAGMRFFSVSNVDGTQLADLTADLDPKATLFVICSKTFTTQETMANAQAARDWIAAELGEAAIGRHFAAASTNHEAMDAFGIDPRFRFPFWEWVGGRYSLWSAIGLSLALVIGMDNFRALLAGGREMDRHFLEAEPAQNMPVLMGLIAVWYNNFLGAESHAILPYSNRLDRFPAYLQQLQMESSGKSVRIDGRPVAAKTGQIIWGEAGSNAQHSFYQLLHQGTRFVPVDFILPVKAAGASAAQQDLAIVNCLAQSEALMEGHADDDAFRRHGGNRPSSTILLEELNPRSLGQLIALYEHKVYVENVIWGTNAFDQFGVELGKQIANSLTSSITDSAPYGGSNASTACLIEKIRAWRRA